MKIQNHKKGLTQVVKITLSFILLFYYISSNAQKDKTPEYSITVYKAKEKKASSTYLTMKAVRFENPKEKKLVLFYRLNNIVINHLNNTVINYKVPYETTLTIFEGKYQIECYEDFNNIKIEDVIIKKGDSMVVKFYLKDIIDEPHIEFPSLKKKKKQN